MSGLSYIPEVLWVTLVSVRLTMNAMQKVAWTELIVSVTAVATATALVPWLGKGAIGGFGILGFVALAVLFVRRRGNRVVVDERDREIEARATKLGVETAWMTLFLVLIAATLWASYSDAKTVSTAFLTWLIWIQFAICYGVKGLTAIVMYRRQQRAA